MAKMKKKGRSISRVKRSNQKRNKLVKKGKLRPSSTSRYHITQAQQHLLKKSAGGSGSQGANKNKDTSLRRSENGAKQDDEDSDSDSIEEMDAEDAFLLRRLGKDALLDGDDSEKIHEAEAQALRRYGETLKAAKKERQLLPIKTKKGVVMRTEEVRENDSDEDIKVQCAEPKETEFPIRLEMASSPNGEYNAFKGPKPGEECSVVALLAERENILKDFKLQIGNMATNFLEMPQERLNMLEKLVQSVDSNNIPIHIKTMGFKLACTTVTEVLKDVIPNYRIAHHNQEGTLQRKETLKLQKYENCLLQSTKSFLLKLENVIKRPKIGKTSVGLHALQCICDLLVSHPHFNYASNIVKLVIPYLNDPEDMVQSVVKEALKKLFGDDKKGEISLIAVRHLKSFVKARRYHCRPAVIECLIALRLNYVDTTEVEKSNQGKKGKKKGVQVSKREKKRLRELAKVEREMLEAKGEEAKVVRSRNFSEVSKIVFEMLFWVIKNNDRPARLLAPALACISKFCHIINVEFFDSLLSVLTSLVKSEELKRPEKLLCIKTAFDVLTGPGEMLTYDPGQLAREVFELLPTVDLSLGVGQAALLSSVLHSMLVKRKKIVSKDAVRSFTKMAASTTLQLAPEDAMDFLSALGSIKSSHLTTFEALLESEEDIPSQVNNYSVESTDVRTQTLWELHVLANHYDNDIRLRSQRLAASGLPT